MFPSALPLHSTPPWMVGAATSCQPAQGARLDSNQQLPASLGLPRPQAAEPSQLQALCCPTAARSGTPGRPARLPTLLRQQTAPALAPSQQPDLACRSSSGYQEGAHALGARLPPGLREQGLQHGSHLKRLATKFRVTSPCPAWATSFWSWLLGQTPPPFPCWGTWVTCPWDPILQRDLNVPCSGAGG